MHTKKESVLGKNFWIVLVIVVAGLIGVFAAAGGSGDGEGSGDKVLANAREAQEDDHKRGEGTEGVTLIEYGDFECPGCGALHPLLQQLETEYGDQIQVIFRHFPLTSIHPNAMAAHRGAQAAASQGMFWQMHDALYEQQFQWRSQSATQAQAIALIEGYATELGLDIDQYKQDVGSGGVFDFVNAHITSGTELGFTGTPTLLLNGEELPTPRSYEELSLSIQNAIDGIGTDANAESTEPTDETPEEEPAN